MNDLSFQIGRYQSRATCFDIQTSAYASVRIMSKHVALDWYLPIWNSRSFLISHMKFPQIYLQYDNIVYLFQLI